jgi:thioredoxin 1
MSKFLDLINGDIPVLVDFFAEWCQPCKMMPPILKEVKEKLGDNVRIIKIDIDKNPEVARQYSVQAVPTMIIFKGGKILWRNSGVTPANQIIKQLQA